MVSRKLTEAHVRQCLGTSNANSKGSDYSFRPQTKSVDPHPITGSTSAAQYGTLLGECSHCTGLSSLGPTWIRLPRTETFRVVPKSREIINLRTYTLAPCRAPPPARAGRTARRFGAPLTPRLARRPLCGEPLLPPTFRRRVAGVPPVRRGALRWTDSVSSGAGLACIPYLPPDRTERRSTGSSTERWARRSS